MRDSARQGMDNVMKAYRKAANLAEKAAQPKKRVSERVFVFGEVFGEVRSR